MHWYFEVLKKYAIFEGRARRKEYWYFFLFSLIVMLILMAIDGVAGTVDEEAGIGLFYGVYVLATLIPTVAVQVRRLHDTDRSGWWALMHLIPLIGPIVLIVFSAQDSKPGQNQYGANPKDNVGRTVGDVVAGVSQGSKDEVTLSNDLKQTKDLLDRGLITEEEYKKKREKILNL